MDSYAAGLMWFRRDLRMADNAALSHAVAACRKLHCVFVFDTGILDPLPREDRRVEFIQGCLVQLDAALRDAAGKPGAGLIVLHGRAALELPALAAELGVQAVFANHDFEPAAMQRDARVLGELARAGIAFHQFKDHVLLERREVLTQAGSPYSVFTPYKKAWLARLPQALVEHGTDTAGAVLAPRPRKYDAAVPGLPAIGFERTNLQLLQLPVGEQGARQMLREFLERIDGYDRARDYPAVKGPSYLGVHLRFGTVSVRALAREASRRADAGSAGAATWLSELAWRDFFFQVLANFRVVDDKGASHCFQKAHALIEWERGPHAKALFAAWCEGRTGFPLVDAAMAQLNTTGYMHNRLRMVTASFLVKHLGIDWRWGERYFAEKLNDFELASNNGNWQWAAGCGCDAQPWFRIFHPLLQSRRFDPEGRFILRYLGQLGGLKPKDLHEPAAASPVELAAAGVQIGRDYPFPIVDLTQARERTFSRFAAVLRKELPG